MHRHRSPASPFNRTNIKGTHTAADAMLLSDGIYDENAFGTDFGLDFGQSTDTLQVSQRGAFITCITHRRASPPRPYTPPP